MRSFLRALRHPGLVSPRGFLLAAAAIALLELGARLSGATSAVGFLSGTPVAEDGDPALSLALGGAVVLVHLAFMVVAPILAIAGIAFAAALIPFRNRAG